MGLLDSLLGVGKLATNVLGGGAGSTKNTNQSSSSTQNSVQATDQVQSSTQNGVQNTTGSQSSQQFSSAFLAQLEKITSDSLGASQLGTAAIGDQIVDNSKPAMDFDVDSFVNGITSAASSQINSGLESGINQTAANTGGSVGANSASALLAGKLRNEATASLAGVKSSATAQGAQIKDQLMNDQVSRSTSLAGAQSTGLAQLLSALKGGAATQTGQQSVVSQTTAQATGSTQQAGQTQSNTKGTATESTPFNWTAGLGNLFNVKLDS
jgi:hypothetical protein